MVTIEISYSLRTYVDDNAEIQPVDMPIGQLLQELTQRYTRLAPHIFSDSGQLRKFILVYLNDEDIRYKEGLEAEVYTESIVKIIPALAGGIIKKFA